MKFLKIDTSLLEKNPVTGDFESADFVFWCEGCKCYHGIWTTNKNQNECIWSFNNDLQKPTVNPSIKVAWSFGSELFVCHSFIRDGMIQYLSDCTHELKGQTVELKDID